MFRATNSPILRSTFELHIQLLVQCMASAADRCHGTADGQQRPYIVPKAVYTVQSAPEDERVCRLKHVGLI